MKSVICLEVKASKVSVIALFMVFFYLELCNAITSYCCILYFIFFILANKFQAST
jgi:hypothetical protein